MLSFLLTAHRLFSAVRKSFVHPAFKSLVFTLFIILLSGTLFYTKIEGWDVLDAIYFSFVSLIPSGVETGLSPATNVGKIFTMMYLMVGIGVMIGLIGLIAKAVLDFDSTEEFISGPKKEKRKKKKKKK